MRGCWAEAPSRMHRLFMKLLLCILLGRRREQKRAQENLPINKLTLTRCTLHICSKLWGNIHWKSYMGSQINTWLMKMLGLMERYVKWQRAQRTFSQIKHLCCSHPSTDWGRPHALWTQVCPSVIGTWQHTQNARVLDRSDDSVLMVK